MFVRKTPARSSESHGIIERVFNTARWTLDRIAQDSEKTGGKKQTDRDWDISLATLENAIRSTIGTGGYTSAQRAFGHPARVIECVIGGLRSISGACEFRERVVRPGGVRSALGRQGD